MQITIDEVEDSEQANSNILDYMILRVPYAEATERIKEAMTYGWEPLGAPFNAMGSTKPTLIQALIKRKP